MICRKNPSKKAQGPIHYELFLIKKFLLISKFLFFYTLTLLGFWIFYFIKYKPKIIYNANNIKKDIINAKSAVASVNAKHNKQYLNNSLTTGSLC
jgi:hypothetical protein